MRQDHGADVAAGLARQLVTPPHRDGGQAQYIDTPWPASGACAFADTPAWAQEHLDEPITVEDLACRSSMSERSFARHFAAATGTTPYRWLLGRVTIRRGARTPGIDRGRPGICVSAPGRTADESSRSDHDRVSRQD